MGQESGKPCWPKPTGGYQTITGRRYGRRHAYVCFRPTPYKHKTMSSVDCQEVETKSIHEEHSIGLSKANTSSMLPAIFPVPSSNLADPKSKTNQDDFDGYPSSSHKMICEKWSSNLDHITGAEKSDSAWAVNSEVVRKPPSVGILSFVNIDSYEPDSSGGEEESLNSHQSCAIQKKLDMIFDVGKDLDDFGHSHGKMLAKFCKLSDCSIQEMSFEPDQEDTFNQKTGKTYGKCGLLGKVQSDACNDSTCSAGSCSCVEPDCTSRQEAVFSEMVVRPKVRKQTSENRLDKKEYSEEDSCMLGAKSFKSTCGSAPPFILSDANKTGFHFSFPPDECTLGKEEQPQRNSKGKIKDDDDDDDFWEDIVGFEKCASPEKGNESSEYSEGEWSASWTSDSGLEKERRSSEESWETLPGLDELPSSSSSLENLPPFTEGEQTPLEEGEIPWLRCNEDSGSSSSDENPDHMSQFVHPGLFIMDSSNNLEDDSSMSEDLDNEWRLLDDFEEGFSMAQAISYVDHPQLLTYMALEERLAQAMEAALAHLESLAIDVEQAHPPASEQIIDSLPHITVLEDNRGQDQSCAVCCCEYVSEEIVTQLPCRHMFHKLCVTLWLRKSGTCPVCRHVLSSRLSDSTTFLSSQENPSFSPSAAGQSR